MNPRTRTTFLFASLAGAATIHVVLTACGGGGGSSRAYGQADGGDMPTSGSIGTPSGAVTAFAGVNAPSGWLACDGSAISRTQYAALYAAIGVASGSGDGVSTFNVPDYRGRFLRGVDDGTGADPDAKSRTAAAQGANVGDAVGSLEAWAFASHQHPVVDPGHAHPLADPGHAHGVTDPGHGHSINDPGHGHQACFGEETETTVEPPGNFGRTADWWENYDGCTNNVVQPHTTGITINSATTGISISSAITNVSVQPSTTGIAVGATGGSVETRPVNVAVHWIIKT